MTGARILVVEDEAIVANDIRLTLEGFGYRPIGTLSSGEHAIQVAHAETPDLVLMDITLRGEMNGVQAAKLIQAQLDIPVVFLTAHADEATLQEAKLMGPYGYIVKPFEERELRTAVEIALFKHESESRVRRSEERLRTITTESADAIIIVDVHHRVRFANPAAERLVGRPVAQLLGEPCPSFLDGNIAGEIEIQRGDEHVVGERRVVPIEWEGEPALLATIRDVTERKRMQEALVHSQMEQVRLRDQFLSHVSHELRTPLAVIHQFVSILLDGIGGELNEQQREFLAITMRNVEQLREMISDLLEVTRVQTGRLHIDPQAMSLRELLQDTVSSWRIPAEAKGLMLQSHLPVDLPLVHADAKRVRQVLVNLIDNAIKFTERGGRITVSAEPSDRTDGFLLVQVADTGRGIPTCELERVFDYLYQVQTENGASRQGLGLGLYICRELIKSHGGQIWAESQPGEGSVFSFTLPCA